MVSSQVRSTRGGTVGDTGLGRRSGHTAVEMGLDVQSAASLFSDWGTRRRILKTKGISEQAEKVRMEVRENRTPKLRGGSMNY
jgi:hypothetical protein